MVDRAKLLRHLAKQRSVLESRYRAFDAEELLAPCTTSEDPGGKDWTPKDHLAHLLRIEEAFLGMARLTVEGDTAPIKIPGSSFEERLAAVHRANEAHIADHADRSVEELLDLLADAREATVAFIDQLSDEQLALDMPGAPWGDGTIAGVLHANSLHEMQHIAWVDEGLAAR